MDRNGRMIYTPLRPIEKPEMSFGAEIRTPQVSENEEHSNGSTLNDEVTEVEYPKSKTCNKNSRSLDIKINEIINKNSRKNKKYDNHCQLYKSIMTKQELLDLINDKIKLDKKQQINLVDIIDQASLNEPPTKDET